MGYMRHHAIVVTSSDLDRIAEAHTVAVGIFSTLSVSTVTYEALNGYRSFLVAPDGSKEGWAESDRGDGARNKFVIWLLSQEYDDGSSPIDWVEVQYGDDDKDTRVVRDSDDTARSKRT